MSGHPRPPGSAHRKLRCERLEPRQMLSANVGSAAALPGLPEFVPAVIRPAVDASLGARDQALAISAVHLLIDDREVTLTSLDRPLEMEVGATLEIVGIDYRLNGEEVVDGKIAFEGYLNQLRGSRVRTDYSDGRFGGHQQEGELPPGAASHDGLSGTWQVEAGTESLTLVMVRYGAEEVVVEDRITIRTQVGTPDFVMHPEVIVKGSSKGIVAGRTVKLYGAWGNEGSGTYRNYMEVDIYHESDPSKIVWSGAIEDTVTAGDYDRGRFVNKVKQDGFSKSWIPELGGTYTLKFYVDPENTWNESDETNNVGTAQLEVKDLRQVARGRSDAGGFGFNHHRVNDTGTGARDVALAIAASEWDEDGFVKATAVAADTVVTSDEYVEQGETLPQVTALNHRPAVNSGLGQQVQKRLADLEQSAWNEDLFAAIDSALSNLSF